MIVTIDTNVTPDAPFESDAEYIQFVMAHAAVSYQNQYGAATADDGIRAAREAHNAALPQASEA